MIKINVFESSPNFNFIFFLIKKKPNRPFVLKKYLHFWPKMEIAIKNKSMHNFEKELLPDVFTGCSVAIGP